MEQILQRYWKIIVVRAHGGRGNYNNLLTFYIVAANIMEASRIARGMPGVKHRLPPRMAYEITYEEYRAGRAESAYYRNGMEMLSRDKRRV